MNAFLGKPPPATIWPKPAERFSEKVHFQRIDVNAPKGPSWWAIGAMGATFAGVGLYSGSWMLAIFIIFIIYSLTSSETVSASNGNADGGGDGSGCGGCGGCGG